MLMRYLKRLSRWCSCEQSSGTSATGDWRLVGCVRCNDCGKLMTDFETRIFGRVAPCLHEHVHMHTGTIDMTRADYLDHFDLRCDDCGLVMRPTEAQYPRRPTEDR